MSDFGAILIIEKNTGSLSSEDKAEITAAISEIITAGDYSEVIIEGDYKTIYGWNEDGHCIKLTEYYDDEDADEVRESAKEEDMEEAQEIAEKLIEKLGNDYTIVAAFEDWLEKTLKLTT